MTKVPTANLVRQTIKQWFWDCYDFLPKLFAANIVLFVVLGSAGFIWLSYLARTLADAPVTFAALSYFVTIVLLLPIWLTLWFAPLGYFAERVSLEKDPRLVDFFIGLRMLGPRCWIYFQICCAIIGVLLLGFWFYLFSPQFGGAAGGVRYFLGGLSFWICLFFLWGMVLGIPIVTRQRHPINYSIKVSMITVFRYPGFLLTIAVFLVSLWVIGIAFKLVGAMLFGFAGTMMLLNSTYDVLLQHEEEAERNRNPPPHASTWKEVQEQEALREKERMDKSRYERTLKDILKPWED